MCKRASRCMSLPLIAMCTLLLLALPMSAPADPTSFTDPMQMLHLPGLDPFQPSVPPDGSVWRGVWPRRYGIWDPYIVEQEGYIDANGNGLVDFLDGIKFMGSWFTILSTTPVIDAQPPILCRCPEYYVPADPPFTLDDPTGSDWFSVENSADPSTWPLLTVESWVDEPPVGLSTWDEVWMADVDPAFGPLIIVGISLSIVIPGSPPVPIEDSSWGRVKSLFKD